MAPLAVDIPDLTLSSLELDARSSLADEPADFISPTLLPKSDHHDSFFSRTFHKRSVDEDPILSPSETFELLTARDVQAATTSINPAAGSINPDDINMKAIQAVFALIGASFVIGGIWFFFWAKNGGFKWRKGDWEDYKSTVLRRKGPNGTTLSNATKSTKLGGGSVVGRGYSDDGSSTWEGTNTVTDLSSEAPVIREKRSSRKAGGTKKQREKAKAAKIREVREETWEGGHDDDMRAYRQEQPARVGGMNKKPDSAYYGTDYSFSEAPTTPTHYSHSQRGSWQAPPPQYSSRNTSPEKRQSNSHNGNGRRNFSYTTDDNFTAQQPQQSSPTRNSVTASRPNRYRSPEKPPARASRAVPGSYDQDNNNSSNDYSDLQSQYTKSYHHPLPGVSSNTNTNSNSNNTRPKAGGGGYRRDRRNSLDD
ncbi:hypothetical protein DV738_g1738, partial [Chaetothyriales sp. CBS 135597]